MLLELTMGIHSALYFISKLCVCAQPTLCFPLFSVKCLLSSLIILPNSFRHSLNRPSLLFVYFLLQIWILVFFIQIKLLIKLQVSSETKLMSHHIYPIFSHVTVDIYFTYFLQPEKSTLRFFLIKSTSILGNSTGFSLLPTEIWP